MATRRVNLLNKLVGIQNGRKFPQLLMIYISSMRPHCSRFHNVNVQSSTHESGKSWPRTAP